MRKTVNGILLVYHHPVAPDAPTIMDHVDAFARHSRFRVWSINTEHGFPESLSRFDFTAIVLHYSLFGSAPFQLNDYFTRYLSSSDAYKIAFFQDEYAYCGRRFDFINQYGIDCIYTLLDPRYWESVYGRHTAVPKLVHTLAGYISNDLVDRAQALTKPDDERMIDVGYRTRTLPFFMGRGAQEKSEIGRRFLERARGTDLKLDIKVDAPSRIYGDAWFEFLANCRGVLGVEAGVSIFDLEDVVREESERLLAADPEMTFDEMSTRLLHRWEDNIFYRVISPRHFEAPALRVCQILFEGKYSGILEPMEHYIPLKKDFSNFDEALALFRDPDVRQRLAENAHRDLVASGRYSYGAFIESFDAELVAAGLQPDVDEKVADEFGTALLRGQRHLRRAARIDAAIHRPFRGRRAVSFVLHPIMKRVRGAYGKWKYRRFKRRVVSEGDS
jgi:hypothetical protein